MIFKYSIINPETKQTEISSIECTKAVKGTDYIKIYNNDDCVMTFYGINNFDIFTLEDGEYSDPPLSQEEMYKKLVELYEKMGLTL